MRSTRPACRHRTSRMFHAVAAVARCESLRASNGPLTLHTGHTEGTAGADQVAPLGGAQRAVPIVELRQWRGCLYFTRA
jgi:hypothetical protein